jgi:hypothetical protein
MQLVRLVAIRGRLQLNLLSAGSVGLVHLVLNLAHPLCLLNAKLLTLLVPSPLVNLAFTEPSLFAD